jgi:hypothetical protein
VRPDAHLGYASRDDNASLAARERLLVHMGMKQQPGEGTVRIGLEHLPVWGEYVPAVGIVLPTGVGVPHGCMKDPSAALSLTYRGVCGLDGPHM